MDTLWTKISMLVCNARYTNNNMDTPLSNEQTVQNTTEIEETLEESGKLNIYPIIRHLFLIVCILLAISIILFLIYQNGKSIYVKGI